MLFPSWQASTSTSSSASSTRKPMPPVSPGPALRFIGMPPMRGRSARRGDGLGMRSALCRDTARPDQAPIVTRGATDADTGGPCRPCGGRRRAGTRRRRRAPSAALGQGRAGHSRGWGGLSCHTDFGTAYLSDFRNRWHCGARWVTPTARAAAAASGHRRSGCRARGLAAAAAARRDRPTSPCRRAASPAPSPTTWRPCSRP